MKFTLLAALAVFVSGCGKRDSGTKINLTGSSTLAPLMSEIAKRYEAENPGVRIDVQTGGSSRGIADAASGAADLGMSSRALKDSEKDGRVTHTVAMDGIGILVNAANPIESLTDEQIVGIFTGVVSNWSEVGGKDAQINVVNRAEGRSELELFQEFYGLKPEDFEVDMISGENQHGIKTVAGDENAIIYMSVGASEFEAENGSPVKLLPLRAIPASSKTVGSGEYPLSRPLILITVPEPSEEVAKFIEYSLSDSVADLIVAQSYVPSSSQ